MSLWLYRQTYQLERSLCCLRRESLRHAQRKSQFDIVFPAQPCSPGPSDGSPRLPPEPRQQEQPLPKAAVSVLLLVPFLTFL